MYESDVFVRSEEKCSRGWKSDEPQSTCDSYVGFQKKQLRAVSEDDKSWKHQRKHKPTQEILNSTSNPSSCLITLSIQVYLYCLQHTGWLTWSPVCSQVFIFCIILDLIWSVFVVIAPGFVRFLVVHRERCKPESKLYTHIYSANKAFSDFWLVSEAVSVRRSEIKCNPAWN